MNLMQKLTLLTGVPDPDNYTSKKKRSVHQSAPKDCGNEQLALEETREDAIDFALKQIGRKRGMGEKITKYEHELPPVHRARRGMHTSRDEDGVPLFNLDEDCKVPVRTYQSL